MCGGNHGCRDYAGQVFQSRFAGLLCSLGQTVMHLDVSGKGPSTCEGTGREAEQGQGSMSGKYTRLGF
jgi:hypothetical protein